MNTVRCHVCGKTVPTGETRRREMVVSSTASFGSVAGQPAFGWSNSTALVDVCRGCDARMVADEAAFAARQKNAATVVLCLLVAACVPLAGLLLFACFWR